jgi:hypothetical protein
MASKKKKYIELPQVENFIAAQSEDVVAEYRLIVKELEKNGRLEMPFGEKVSSILFAIRVIQSGNIRVFYVYDDKYKIYGIYGYVKTTKVIPQKEKDHAVKIIKFLRQKGLIK